MAMAMVIWAAAAEVIIMDGAGDTVVTTAGDAVIIVTITETPPENTSVISGESALPREFAIPQVVHGRPVRCQ
jgi:predicted GTPase